MASSSKTVVASKGLVGTHSVVKEEQIAFCEHINNCLGKDAFLKENGYVPLVPDSDDLYKKCADGILFSKLINLASPDTIDERALNFPSGGKALNPWEVNENQNIVINSAKSIGCQVVNIHAADLSRAVEEHKEYLVLGLTWQVVKVQLLAQISIKEHPELVKLLKPDEELVDMLKLPPEDVLLRWINHHLEKQGSTRRVTNFSSDLKDSEAYLILLNSIDGEKCPKEAALAETDPLARARQVIENARALDVPAFIQPGDIASGNRHLNLAFAAQVFNTRHGLEATKEEIAVVEEAFEAAGLSTDAEDDAREERVFRLWMNSLNLGESREAGPYVLTSLFDDLMDGLVILETIDKVVPGTVDWTKVNRDPAKLNAFKKVENCNYCVTLGKGLSFSLPATGGKDIVDKKRKLVLGYVWQLMRLQVVKLLQQVGGGEVPKDADIVAWANAAVASVGKSNISISSFKDSNLASGVYLLDLLAAVEPRAINPDIPTPGETAEDKEKNAKYILSVARKIGTQVFMTWEDIVDVKPKMIMTLIASIMHRSKEIEKEKADKGKKPHFRSLLTAEAALLPSYMSHKNASSSGGSSARSSTGSGARGSGTSAPRAAAPSAAVARSGGSGLGGPSLEGPRRASCHRCGNIRKAILPCPNCPHITCLNCAAKLLQEFGPACFEKDCPTCRRQCCCFAPAEADACDRHFHCYKRCPALKKQGLTGVEPAVPPGASPLRMTAEAAAALAQRLIAASDGSGSGGGSSEVKKKAVKASKASASSSASSSSKSIAKALAGQKRKASIVEDEEDSEDADEVGNSAAASGSSAEDAEETPVQAPAKRRRKEGKAEGAPSRSRMPELARLAQLTLSTTGSPVPTPKQRRGGAATRLASGSSTPSSQADSEGGKAQPLADLASLAALVAPDTPQGAGMAALGSARGSIGSAASGRRLLRGARRRGGGGGEVLTPSSSRSALYTFPWGEEDEEDEEEGAGAVVADGAYGLTIPPALTSMAGGSRLLTTPVLSPASQRLGATSSAAIGVMPLAAARDDDENEGEEGEEGAGSEAGAGSDDAGGSSVRAPRRGGRRLSREAQILRGSEDESGTSDEDGSILAASARRQGAPLPSPRRGPKAGGGGGAGGRGGGGGAASASTTSAVLAGGPYASAATGDSFGEARGGRGRAVEARPQLDIGLVAGGEGGRLGAGAGGAGGGRGVQGAGLSGGLMLDDAAASPPAPSVSAPTHSLAATAAGTSTAPLAAGGPAPSPDPMALMVPLPGGILPSSSAPAGNLGVPFSGSAGLSTPVLGLSSAGLGRLGGTSLFVTPGPPPAPGLFRDVRGVYGILGTVTASEAAAFPLAGAAGVAGQVATWGGLPAAVAHGGSNSATPGGPMSMATGWLPVKSSGVSSATIASGLLVPLPSCVHPDSAAAAPSAGLGQTLGTGSATVAGAGGSRAVAGLASYQPAGTSTADTPSVAVRPLMSIFRGGDDAFPLAAGTRAPQPPLSSLTQGEAQTGAEFPPAPQQPQCSPWLVAFAPAPPVPMHTQGVRQQSAPAPADETEVQYPVLSPPAAAAAAAAPVSAPASQQQQQARGSATAETPPYRR